MTHSIFSNACLVAFMTSKCLRGSYSMRMREKAVVCAMDGLCSLSPDLPWGPSSLPTRKLILVTDRLASNGSFIAHHFAALFLKAGILSALFPVPVSRK